MNKKYYRVAVKSALISRDEFNLIINKNLALATNFNEIEYCECIDFKYAYKKFKMFKKKYSQINTKSIFFSNYYIGYEIILEKFYQDENGFIPKTETICWWSHSLLDVKNYIDHERVMSFNKKWKQLKQPTCIEKFQEELDEIGEWVEIYFDELDPEVAKMVRRVRK